MLQRPVLKIHPLKYYFRSRALRVSRLVTITPVEKILCNSIRASGPVPVSTYMQLCLSHPTEGYYMKWRPNDGDVFGVKGDFITSPEISQVFGELLSLWLLSIWRNPETGTPHPNIRIVELGPGRGTLMDDILRTLFTWPNSRNAITGVHLIENSPMMRSRQAQKLATWRETHHIPFHWWDSIEDIPMPTEDEFTMVVAHEFFDALPINILEENTKTPSGFREVLIDLRPPLNDPPIVPSTASEQPQPSPQFQFVLSSTPTLRSDFLSTLSSRFVNLPSGSRVEVSTFGWRIARAIGEIVSGNEKQATDTPMTRRKSKGAGLIIDYGDEHAFGGSFRAFRAHRHVNVFDKPGMSDLTTNVDFALLKEALNGQATSHGSLDQSSFLLRMGIAQRLAGLIRNSKNKERRAEIGHAGQKLVDPTSQGMGRVYRVLGITGNTGGQNKAIWPFMPLHDKEIGSEKEG